MDIIKGIGVCAGLDSINVIGATGTIHTNFDGKDSHYSSFQKDGKDLVYTFRSPRYECSSQGFGWENIKILEFRSKNCKTFIIKYLK
ncbi:hypothetical protein AN643_02495 [Candidatus Epulonipiscioides saccharophilum]|nr:hypothetical protein AN643_02495 [Epulopiscium sp. SCG-B10WGA-EpuloB]